MYAILYGVLAIIKMCSVTESVRIRLLFPLLYDVLCDVYATFLSPLFGIERR